MAHAQRTLPLFVAGRLEAVALRSEWPFNIFAAAFYYYSCCLLSFIIIAAVVIHPGPAGRPLLPGAYSSPG